MGVTPEFRRFIIVFILCSVRMGAAMTMLPALSSSLVGGLVRRALTLAFASVLVPPALRWMPSGDVDFAIAGVIGMKEAVIGFLIGFIASIPFTVAENVGNYIDNQRGATMGEMFSPLSGTQVSTTGIFFTQLTSVIFYAGGAVFAFLGAVYFSYGPFPLFGGFSFTAAAPTEAIALVDSMVAKTVVISAPVIILMLLATIGLGFVNRTAPQLNVFFLSMPVKSALGLAMLTLYLQFVVDVLMYGSRGAILGPLARLIR